MTMHKLSLAAAIVTAGLIAPLSIEAAATAITARLNAFQPESDVTPAAVRCWQKCIAKKPCGFRYSHYSKTSQQIMHGKTCCLAYETVCPTPPRDVSRTLRPIPIPTPGPPPRAPAPQLPGRR
jgi:hypothetical protein